MNLLLVGGDQVYPNRARKQTARGFKRDCIFARFLLQYSRSLFDRLDRIADRDGFNEDGFQRAS
jgi:hypothetical protein